MKKFALTTAAFAALSASPLAAQDQTASVADADGNGTFSLEELQATYPELTPEVFAKIDVNADGEADADELVAAQEAGLLASAS